MKDLGQKNIVLLQLQGTIQIAKSWICKRLDLRPPRTTSSPPSEGRGTNVVEETGTEIQDTMNETSRGNLIRRKYETIKRSISKLTAKIADGYPSTAPSSEGSGTSVSESTGSGINEPANGDSCDDDNRHDDDTPARSYFKLTVEKSSGQKGSDAPSWERFDMSVIPKARLRDNPGAEDTIHVHATCSDGAKVIFHSHEPTTSRDSATSEFASSNAEDRRFIPERNLNAHPNVDTAVTYYGNKHPNVDAATTCDRLTYEFSTEVGADVHNLLHSDTAAAADNHSTTAFSSSGKKKTHVIRHVGSGIQKPADGNRRGSIDTENSQNVHNRSLRSCRVYSENEFRNVSKLEISNFEGVTSRQGLGTYVRNCWFSKRPRGTVIPSCVTRDSFSGLGLPTTLAYRRLRTYLPTSALRTTPAYSTYTTSGDRLLLDSSSADTLIPCGQKDPSSGLLDLASLPAVHLRPLTTPVRSSPVRPHVSRVAPSALAAVLCSQTVDDASTSPVERLTSQVLYPCNGID